MVAAVPRPRPVPTLRPEEPSPVEMQQWYQQSSNARNQYQRQLAQSNYGRGQAGLAYQTGLRNMRYNQGLQRQSFDDPFIGRGIYNSGIRGQALSNFGTNYYNQFSDLQNQYTSAMGQYGMSDLQNRSVRDQTIQAARDAEHARRVQLQQQINLVK